MKWLDLDVSGHANTETARIYAYVRTTTFNNIGATTNATASFLCEWFVCAVTAVMGHNGVVLI